MKKIFILLAMFLLVGCSNAEPQNEAVPAEQSVEVAETKPSHVKLMINLLIINYKNGAFTSSVKNIINIPIY